MADPALGAAVAALAADVANVEAGLVAFSVFDAAGVRIGRVLDYTADASSAVVALTVGATAQLLAPPFGNVVTSSVVYAVNLAESTVARVAPVNNVLGVMPDLIYQFPDCSGGPYFRGEASAAHAHDRDPLLREQLRLQ